jgi:hypothetical protein
VLGCSRLYGIDWKELSSMDSIKADSVFGKTMYAEMN